MRVVDLCGNNLSNQERPTEQSGEKAHAFMSSSVSKA
jgi:hypothetical protein